MKKEQRKLTKIPKSNYNPKFYSSDLKLIFDSLKGTRFYDKEIARQVFKFRSDGWRWNVVEDAIDEEHSRRCAPIIDQIIEDTCMPKQNLEALVNLLIINRYTQERRLQDKNEYIHKITKLGCEGIFYDFVIKKIIDYLKTISAIFDEIKIAEMTLEHYEILKSFSCTIENYELLWNKDILNIIKSIYFDDLWMKKVDLIISELYRDQKKNPKSILSREIKRVKEVFYQKYCEEADAYLLDDNCSDYFRNQDAEDYNNRGAIRGLRYYCDLDDLDDGLREEF